MRAALIVGFAALALFGGCSADGAATFAEPTQIGTVSTGRRSVCVASGMGHTFHHTQIGLTVFGNNFRTADIQSWRVDDAILGKIAALLSGSADVHKLALTPAAIAQLDEPAKPFTSGGEKYQKVVEDLAKSRKCDHYLLVAKGYSPFGTSNIQLAGIGVAETNSPLTGAYTSLYALFHLRLYDGATLKIANTKLASIGQSTFIKAIRGPHCDVDAFWRIEPGAVAGDTRYREAIRELLDDGLRQTLPTVLSITPAKTAAATNKK